MKRKPSTTSTPNETTKQINIKWPEAITLEPRQIPIIAITVALALSTCFQIGYFSAVGLEFISMLGPSDYLYSLGLTLVPLIIAAPFAALFFGSASRSIISRGDASLWLKFLRNGIWLFLVILTPLSILAALHGYELVGHSLRWIAILAIFSVGSAYLAASAVGSGAIELKRLGFVLAGFLCFAISVGFVFGRNYAGRNCEFSYTDGSTANFIYLRSVGAGHLLREGNKAIFITGDQISRISCYSNFLE